jgi:hypothetical protein
MNNYAPGQIISKGHTYSCKQGVMVVDSPGKFLPTGTRFHQLCVGDPSPRTKYLCSCYRPAVWPELSPSSRRLSTSSQVALLRPGFSASLSVSGMFRSGTGCMANGEAFGGPVTPVFFTVSAVPSGGIRGSLLNTLN